MATLSWDEVGGNPAPGDPPAFDALGTRFSQIAADAADARSKLDSFARGVDDSIWRGESARAFKDKIEDLPPRLTKLHDSYSTAAEGMAGYGRTLQRLQTQARAALGQAQTAENERASQQRSRDQARDADPAAPTTAHDEALDAAQSRLDGARSRIDDIGDERRGAESAAIARLEHAQDQGIENDPWYKRAWDAIDAWVDEHADFLKQLSQILSFVAGILSVIPGLQGLALVVGALAVLTNVLLAATGNGDWKTLLIDAALTVVGAGAGKLLMAGYKAYKGSKAARAASRTDIVKRCPGDPIDVATGEMVMSQIDVELPGILPVVLSRSHVSSYRAGRSFGPSWASTLDQRIQRDGERAYLSTESGMLIVYRVPSDSVPILPEEGPRWPLVVADDGFSVTVPERGHTLLFSTADGSSTAPLAALTDRNGHRIDIDRDVDGIATGIRHSGGYRIEVEATDGLVRALHLRGTDGGRDFELIRYGFDEEGDLREVINSSGSPLRLEYDDAGRVARWEDRNGAWYAYGYDDEGRCVEASGSDGYLAGTYNYDRRQQLTVWTNSLGHATTFRMNDQSQVVQEVDPLGGTVASEWDRYDRLLARTDAIGRTTRYVYDSDGNLTSVVRPDGSYSSGAYNELRMPVSITDPDGAVWHHEYDDRGNLTAVTDPVGATTTYGYDGQGHRATVTDGLGHRRRLETDAAGLVVALIDPLGATTRYDRDAFGRVVAITDPIGGVTRLEWTVEGRLTARTSPDGSTERWSYDAEGNLVGHVDADGHVTRTEIGPFDLPVAATEPNGARLELSYDTELRLVGVTNPQGLVWRYDYDPAGNLVQETDFNGRTLRYAFDAAGQLVGRTSAGGETTRFVRDALGRVSERRCGALGATFDRNANGRVVRARNGDAHVSFERDASGRVLAERCNGRSVTASYDLLGRRTHRRTPSGAESSWEYDAHERPVAMHAAGSTLRFRFDAAGREVERLLGGATLAQTWDGNNRLACQTLTSAPVPLIQRRAYRYRADGCVTGIEDHLSGDRALDLDEVGRVAGLEGRAWAEHYAYDRNGSILHAQWPEPAQPDAVAADALGEREYAGTLIRRAGNIRYEHDADGRMVLRQQKRLSAKPRTWRYTWDADDQLVAVATPDGEIWRYLYDPLGRRIAKQRLAPDGVGVAEQIDFTWDGTVLAEQTAIGSGRATSWEWEPGTFRAVSQAERSSSRDAPQDWIDQQFYAIVTDPVGTPMEMLDPDGNIAWHRRATLWGVLATEGAAADCPLRFPGQIHDPETGLSYNYFRYYDPTTGRYASSDPLGFAPGVDPYGYVPNPTSWLDPFGLSPCQAAGGGGHAPSPAPKGVAEAADDIPRVIYRGGGSSPSNLRLRPDEDALSFRDSLSNPLPPAKPVFQGKDFIAIDTSKLPPGSVRPDGIPGSATTPPGHVSVYVDDPQILKDAIIEKGKFPK